jgi:hypothetical protein
MEAGGAQMIVQVLKTHMDNPKVLVIVLWTILKLLYSFDLNNPLHMYVVGIFYASQSFSSRSDSRIK